MMINPIEINKIDDVYAIILRNPHENYTLARLARMCGLTSSQLSKAFREIHGIEITDFILINRMYHARKLLATDKSIKEICSLAGYSSVASFNKSFKRFHSYPPAQFRNSKKVFTLISSEINQPTRSTG